MCLLGNGWKPFRISKFFAHNKIITVNKCLEKKNFYIFKNVALRTKIFHITSINVISALLLADNVDNMCLIQLADKTNPNNIQLLFIDNHNFSWFASSGVQFALILRPRLHLPKHAQHVNTQWQYPNPYT